MGHSRHARYWRRFLLPGEQPIHTFGMSGLYITLFWGAPLLLVLGLTVLLGVSNALLGVLLLVLVAAAVVPIVYLFFFVHYAITDRRVMSREGIFHKRFTTVDLWSITDATVQEPFLERLFTRSGTIGINTAGSPRVELFYRHVRRPFALRKDIYRHKQDIVRNGRPPAPPTH